MMDMTPFSGASQRINNETEPKEHKTCALSHIRLWEAVLGSWGGSLILWKCPQFLKPPSISCHSCQIMVADPINREKKPCNISPPPQMTPDSKSVLEKQDRAGRSTFLFQTMSQRHRIKQCCPRNPTWLWQLSIRLLTSPPALISGSWVLALGWSMDEAWCLLKQTRPTKFGPSISWRSRTENPEGNMLWYNWFFNFFILYFVEGSYYVYYTLKSGKLCSWTWQCNVCTNCLKFFCMGDFSSLWVCLFLFQRCFLFIWEREERKTWARGAEGEGEAGSLLNREPDLGPGSWSWSEPNAEA